LPLSGETAFEASNLLPWLHLISKTAFRYFKTSPEVIQLAVMMYVRFQLSLRNVEDLFHKRGVAAMKISGFG